MTPRESRRERRAAERKTRKAEIRRTKDFLSTRRPNPAWSSREIDPSDHAGPINATTPDHQLMLNPPPYQPAAAAPAGFVSQNAAVLEHNAAALEWLDQSSDSELQDQFDELKRDLAL